MKTPVLALAIGATIASGAARAADAPANPLYAALGSPDNWKISGTFRARMEGIDGQFRPAPAAESDGFLSLRTTLFAEYDAGPVRIGGELFDSRGYLEKANSTVSTSEINAVELGQAYLAFRLPGAPDNAITAGRFTMDDGSRRLIARNQFRNTINAFTGVKLDWEDGAKDKLFLFWTMPQTRLPSDTAGIQDNKVEWDRESPDLQFYGGSFTKAHVFGGTFQLYGYQLSERDSPAFPTKNRHLFTPGARLYRAPRAGLFDYDFEGTYQTGHERGTTAASDVKNLHVSAYFFHAEIGHSFATAWSPRIAIQYDRASGDGSNSNSYNRFDTLFGARRSEYGPTSLYGAVARANLSSPSLRLEAKPSKRLDGFIAWRPLWAENDTDSFSGTSVRDKTGNSGSFAGNQIEARVRYWVIPKIARAEVGAAYLAKGRLLKDAPNAPDDGDTRYGYADLTFTF